MPNPDGIESPWETTHAAKSQQKSLKCWFLQYVGCQDNQPLSAAVESHLTMWSHVLPAQLNCYNKSQAAGHIFSSMWKKILLQHPPFFHRRLLYRNYPIFCSKFLMRERETMTILGIFLFLYKMVSRVIFTYHLKNVLFVLHFFPFCPQRFPFHNFILCSKWIFFISCFSCFVFWFGATIHTTRCC